MTEFDVLESATIAPRAEDATGKRWNAVLIKSGWGSKGFYTEEALRRDGPTVFKAGTPIFLDHQTPEERELRPFGSVANLAGELATDAYWSEEQQGLVAEVEIFEHEQARVKSLAKRVGLSIRARTIAERGTAEGRSGRIFTGLVGARSVDLVVRAGAGGQLLDVLESDIDTEMEEQQMDEVLNELKSLGSAFEAFDKRLSDIEESLTAEAEAETETPAPEATKTDEPTLTIDDIRAAIADEVSKLHKADVAESDVAGTEENADEVEESATDIVLPTHWAAKEKK